MKRLYGVEDEFSEEKEGCPGEDGCEDVAEDIFKGLLFFHDDVFF